MSAGERQKTAGEVSLDKMFENYLHGGRKTANLGDPYEEGHGKPSRNDFASRVVENTESAGGHRRVTLEERAVQDAVSHLTQILSNTVNEQHPGMLDEPLDMPAAKELSDVGEEVSERQGLVVGSKGLRFLAKPEDRDEFAKEVIASIVQKVEAAAAEQAVEVAQASAAGEERPQEITLRDALKQASKAVQAERVQALHAQTQQSAAR